VRVEKFLEESAARFPDKPAVIAGEQRLGYAELDRLANRWAQLLRRRGVLCGDRVAVFLDNSTDAVASIFATLKAGAVFSPVNATTKAEKLAYILGNCGARAVFTSERLLPVVRQAVGQAPSVRTVIVVDARSTSSAESVEVAAPAILVDFPATKPDAPGIDIDLAMLIYTSGSTGFPKGVMMTHLNIVAAAESITTYLENTSEDVILNVLPLSFDYGLYQALMSARLGATLVLMNSFAYPALVLEQLRKHRVTGFPVVPTMAAILLQMRDLVPGTCPDLRYITNTAAALPPAHIMRLQELFPTTRIYSMYGLTECKRCTYLPPEQLRIRPASVGKAIPNTQAYIVDADGRRVGPGEVGELVIRGGHVMKGYWDAPEATDRVLRPGPFPWEKVLYTGDLFRMDEEGFLYVVGRKDDIIKTRGEKVSPREVEDVVCMLNGIKEAVVIGVPDVVLGQAIHAVVVAGDGASLTEQDVLRHCVGHLEDFMVPRAVHFRQALPKTDSGKIRRADVRLDP
jgi:amino acid adenylation domain-containing protein